MATSFQLLRLEDDHSSEEDRHLRNVAMAQVAVQDREHQKGNKIPLDLEPPVVLENHANAWGVRLLRPSLLLLENTSSPLEVAPS